MKKSITGFALSLAVMAASPLITKAETDVVEPDKEWNITFNTVLDEASVNDRTVFVTNAKGEHHEVNYSLKMKTNKKDNNNASVLTVDPKVEYKEGEYELKITKGIKSSKGINMNEDVLHTFTVEEGDLKDPGDGEEIITKDYMNMSLDELKKTYGDVEYIARSDSFGTNGIIKKSLMETYYRTKLVGIFRDENAKEPTKEFLLNDFADEVLREVGLEDDYPKAEIISVDGVAFKDTATFERDIFRTLSESSYGVDQREIYYWLPSTPSEEGQFFADIALYSNEYATYFKDGVLVNELNKVVYEKEGEQMIDVKALFEGTNFAINEIENGISVKNPMNGMQLTLYHENKEALHNNQQVKLSVSTDYGMQSNEYGKTEFMYVPVSDLGKYLGLDIRRSHSFGRLQIANYDLPDLEGVVKDENIQKIIR